VRNAGFGQADQDEEGDSSMNQEDQFAGLFDDGPVVPFSGPTEWRVSANQADFDAAVAPAAA
jgi:hypothetical protein